MCLIIVVLYKFFLPKLSFLLFFYCHFSVLLFPNWHPQFIFLFNKFLIRFHDFHDLYLDFDLSNSSDPSSILQFNYSNTPSTLDRTFFYIIQPILHKYFPYLLFNFSFYQFLEYFFSALIFRFYMRLLFYREKMILLKWKKMSSYPLTCGSFSHFL